ncbi:MAG: protein kinase [Phycisphaeraceae bacterium]|nr:protein kinase [Phycisphaeraceae bacterium]
MITNAETWLQAERLFHAALELDPAGRSGFLDSACLGDGELRRSVETLLRGHESAGDDFMSPPEVTVPEPAIPPGIGKYRVVRLIASGGMGSVYEALQDSPARTVAIKVVRTPWASAPELHRFTQEAQILARLNHPGIAKVFEAGVFQSGTASLPFIALEYIGDATPITTFAAALSIPAKLQLFAQVCDAIHHGHQRGVIHRDLKPQNILVRPDGHPIVIDFGIARLIEAPSNTRHTVTGQFIGTLSYTSPEQAEGDPDLLDIRADVYSLGAVLYELVCGRPPIEVDGMNLFEAVQRIRSIVPPTPRSLAPEVDRDLETIILTALAKDRSRRYSSVASLVDDLHRYGRHEPISARPATAAYHARMFIRRHRTLATGAAIAAAGLALGTAGAMWQADTARDERDRARLAELRAINESDAAKRVAACLESSIAALDPAGITPEASRAIMLSTSANVIDRELTAQPITKARLLRHLATAYANLGLPDRAKSLFQGALHNFDRAGIEPSALVGLRAQLATACMETADFEEAERQARLILAVESSPATAEARTSAGTTIARMLRAKGEHEQAKQAAQSAVAESLQYGYHRMAARFAFGEALEAAGNLVESRKQFEAAVAESSSLLERVEAGFALSRFDRRHGRNDAANAAFAAALADWKVITRIPTSHGAALSRRLALDSLTDASWDAAAVFLADAIQQTSDVYSPTHPDVGLLSMRLGEALQMLNRPAEAASAYRAAVTALRRSVGDEHPDVGAALFHLARLAVSTADSETLDFVRRESAPLVKTAQTLPTDHPHRSGLLLLQGFLEMHTGDPLAAEAPLRECIAIRQRTVGPDHRITAYAQTVLGECLARQGRFEEAEARLVMYVPRVEAKYIPGSFMSAESRQRLVQMYLAWGRPDQAEAARR